MRKTMWAGALCLVLQVAYADSNTGGPPSGNPPGPPPEAVSACSGKSAGDTVTFTLRDGKQVSGTCQLENGVLAARPDHMQGGGPPSGDNSGSH
jgi:hypothetical protein